MNIKQLAIELSNGVFNTKYISVSLGYTAGHKDIAMLGLVIKSPHFTSNSTGLKLEHKKYFSVRKRFRTVFIAPHTKESLKVLETVYGAKLSYTTTTFL